MQNFSREKIISSLTIIILIGSIVFTGTSCKIQETIISSKVLSSNTSSIAKLDSSSQSSGISSSNVLLSSSQTSGSKSLINSNLINKASSKSNNTNGSSNTISKQLVVDLPVNYGFYVDANGVIKLNGKPYYGIGINSFHTFIRHKNDQEDISYKADFALMKKYNIPFVRMPLCVYWASEYKLYEQSPDIYFDAMDDIIREAEKQKIGIIASLLWWYPAVCDYVGEPCSKIGDPKSKTVAFAKKYIASVVQRYKGSPAIWGWEIGNEYALAANLNDEAFYPAVSIAFGTPAKRTSADAITLEQVASFYKEIGKEIRKYDSYRLITNGDAQMREAAYHLSESGGNNWTFDTYDEFKQVNTNIVTSPLNTISYHFYNTDPQMMQQRFADYEGQTPDKISITDYFNAYVKVSKELKKGLFLGEFGMLEETPEGNQYLTNPQLWETTFAKITNAIQETGIQLSSVWMFPSINGYITPTDTTNEKFKLEEISQVNKNFITKNQQDTSKYWPNTITIPEKPPSNVENTKEFAITDDMNDWSKADTHSSGLIFNTALPESFGASRVIRDNKNASPAEYITYKNSKITGFKLIGQFGTCEEPIIDFKYFSSSDGTTWTPVPQSAFTFIDSFLYGGSWTKRVYSINTLPTGTTHIKIQFPVSGVNSFNPNLDQVIIKNHDLLN